MSIARHVLVGVAAGAAGTAALNIATYADVAIRGRAESSVPSMLVKNLAAAWGLGALTSDDGTTQRRRAAIGALLGYANGLAIGAVYGALRPALRGVPVLIAAVAVGAAAMAASDVPIAKSGASDPRTWDAASWTADAIPHLFYGLALALSFDALDQ
jgi:hypothetical protein